MTRFWINYPLNTRTALALDEVYQRLKGHFDGLTCSSQSEPTPFYGIWRSPEYGLLEEPIVLFMADVKTAFVPVTRIFLAKFKEGYEAKLNEEEIWIIFQSGERITSPGLAKHLHSILTVSPGEWVKESDLASLLKTDVASVRTSIGALEFVGLAESRSGECRYPL